MAGTWDVSGQERLDGEYRDVTGTSVVRGALDGCALIENVSGDRAGSPYEIIQLFVVTPDSTVQQARLDSNHGQIALAEGDLWGDSLILETSHDLGNRVLRNRYVIQRGTDRYQRQTFLSRSEDSPWELVHWTEYVRRPE